jgi:ubiquinone/menaquinone biosynthesis C-methylase UbiE
VLGFGRIPAENKVVAYDSLAAWYDDWVRTRAVVHRVSVPAVTELVGDGNDVLDLACGQGVLAREVARSGRRVVGVDISPELIRLAREEEVREPLGVRYLVDDATTLAQVADASFDGVACNLALTDIDDLDAAFRSERRVLRPDGWFTFATVHPCFASPHARGVEVEGRTLMQVGRYFEEGRWYSDNPEGLRGRLGSIHRRLSTILNALVEAGFHIERLAEPRGTEDIVDKVPIYGEVAEVLVVRCGRG